MERAEQERKRRAAQERKKREEKRRAKKPNDRKGHPARIGSSSVTSTAAKQSKAKQKG